MFKRGKGCDEHVKKEKKKRKNPWQDGGATHFLTKGEKKERPLSGDHWKSNPMKY